MTRQLNQCAICVVCAVIVVIGASAQAGELDTARQCYAAISDGLGNPTWAEIDTDSSAYSYLFNALNAGLRAIQTDVPFTGKDTITIVEDQFIYPLNGALVQPPDQKPGDPWRPSGYSIVVVTPDGELITGVEEKPLDRAGVVSYAMSSTMGFAVRGSDLVIYPAAPATATIYVYGPGEITPVTGKGTVLSYPPETSDRWAAVYYAIATIAGERNDPETVGEYQQKYNDYVMARTGRLPVTGGP